MTAHFLAIEPSLGNAPPLRSDTISIHRSVADLANASLKSSPSVNTAASSSPLSCIVIGSVPIICSFIPRRIRPPGRKSSVAQAPTSFIPSLKVVCIVAPAMAAADLAPKLNVPSNTLCFARYLAVLSLASLPNTLLSAYFAPFNVAVFVPVYMPPVNPISRANAGNSPSTVPTLYPKLVSAWFAC